MRNLFNIVRLKSSVGTTRTLSTDVESKGAFVTSQTLTSFAGASFVVALCWRTSEIFHNGWAANAMVGLIISLIVGALLFTISVADPRRGRMSASEWIIESSVAVINSLLLFSAAVGGSELAGV